MPPAGDEVVEAEHAESRFANGEGGARRARWREVLELVSGSSADMRGALEWLSTMEPSSKSRAMARLNPQRSMRAPRWFLRNCYIPVSSTASRGDATCDPWIGDG